MTATRLGHRDRVVYRITSYMWIRAEKRTGREKERKRVYVGEVCPEASSL